MARLPDIVRDTKLATHFLPDCSVETVHTYLESDPTSRQRLVSRLEHWKRHKKVGGGGCGSVWLEKYTAGARNGATVRAVKQIDIEWRFGQVDYNRELEPIAKFSHPKVGLPIWIFTGGGRINGCSMTDASLSHLDDRHSQSAGISLEASEIVRHSPYLLPKHLHGGDLPTGADQYGPDWGDGVLPNAKVLAVAEPGAISLWNLDNWEEAHRLKTGDWHPAYSIAFPPYGMMLAAPSCSLDKQPPRRNEVIVWKVDQDHTRNDPHSES